MNRATGLILAALLALAGAWALAGCGEDAVEFKPAPDYPTDAREAARVEAASRTYRRTSRLIAEDFAACVKRLPPGFEPRACRLDVEALSRQRASQLSGAIAPLADGVGPRCGRALRAVLDGPVASAGEPLSEAVRACGAEFESARAAR